MTTRGKHSQLAQRWRGENFPSLPPSFLRPHGGCRVFFFCFCFFSHRGICAALMRSERGVPASLRGFKPPTSVHTRRAPTATTHDCTTARLQPHSAVLALLSLNLQGREGAPAAKTHQTPNLFAAPRDGTATPLHPEARAVPPSPPSPPQRQKKNPKTKQNIEPPAPH